jgi:hypothetical protein
MQKIAPIFWRTLVATRVLKNTFDTFPSGKFPSLFWCLPPEQTLNKKRYATKFSLSCVQVECHLLVLIHLHIGAITDLSLVFI